MVKKVSYLLAFFILLLKFRYFRLCYEQKKTQREVMFPFFKKVGDVK